jgi:vancomycin permeability regulator SanA
VIFYRFVVKTLALLVTLVIVLLVGVAGRVWWVARSDDRRPSDVIVVLGAAQFDGRPSSILTARLDHARKLVASGVAPRVITVGGKRAGDRFTEAAAGERWLANQGVPARSVVPVNTGSNTLDSLQAVARKMELEGWSSAVIVTDPWHALRARTIAKDEGIDAVTSPTRQGPAVRTRATQIRYVTREALVYVYYRVFHRSPELGPSAL